MSDFEQRHIGPSIEDQKELLKTLEFKTLDELILNTIPENILSPSELNLSTALHEAEFLNKIGQLAEKNRLYKSYIGQGFHPCHTPTVILRNVLENPGWYTQYTPYQAEISQGRLEALLNFQTVICELTSMDIANASLLDDATAAAEGLTMMYRCRPDSKKDANVCLVSKHIFPQILAVLETRAKPLGLELKYQEDTEFEFNADVFGCITQYPNANGDVKDLTPLTDKAHQEACLCTVITDLMSLTILKTPGEMNADIVVGNSQRFGVPMGFGGPHAAFFATKNEFSRQIPGRIIGKTIDKHGNPALRMALQTREQHIRRDKATSNICTAQALLASIASFYAIYHGPQGLKDIGYKIHALTTQLYHALKKEGFQLKSDVFFDTLIVEFKSETDRKPYLKKALESKINMNTSIKNSLGISINETTTGSDILKIITVFSDSKSSPSISLSPITLSLPDALLRKSTYLNQALFKKYHSETELLRYIKYLEEKDLSLAHSMIPLGSCTMKLNATTEMIPITWSAFNALHPFSPANQTKGYKEIITELEKDLAEILGFDAVSLQPNSGAQGEYAGLMVIREYHHSTNQHHRNVILIPTSAHGTNPASAAMAGMTIVPIKCLDNGNIDIHDLTQKCNQHTKELAGLMVTYPSTFGIFEEDIKAICDLVHQHGGQVYMDGANLNAQVGLTSPGYIGADICHVNLHKTFSIPHGGGGPGMGPIACKHHLAPFLPNHPVVSLKRKGPAVSASPWGSASILLISYAYIKLLGGSGCKKASQIAILNANYIKHQLAPHYPILFQGKKGNVAHELIIDLRPFKKTAKIEVEDLAKRLMDYGFHAPTMSWPVPGTLMIEPTESESKAELDRFCEAMISIREEIREIETGQADSENNPLKNAPHTLVDVIQKEWTAPYSREKAVFPLAYIQKRKFWPTVNRVNQAHGDRNLICTCGSVEDY